MPWATLGEIEFEVLNTPQSMSFSRGWNFAEHSRIDGKPRLQQVGGILNKIGLSIRLHRAFSNPQERIDELINLSDEQKPLTFILGDVSQGDFVITDLEVIYRRLIAGEGKEPLLLWADLTLSLLENPIEPGPEPLDDEVEEGLERVDEDEEVDAEAEAEVEEPEETPEEPSESPPGFRFPQFPQLPQLPPLPDLYPLPMPPLPPFL